MDKDITMKIKMGPKSFSGIKDLANNQKIDETELLSLCKFVDLRYDCADFRLLTIIRVLYDYKDLISRDTFDKLEDTLLKFKYWMDEPGADSMCYWSENHQLLFFTCQYLAGQYAPDKVFINSNTSGSELMKKSKKRILRWLKRRFEYGFVEWHSNTYYEEDIAPLSNLIDFANDDEIINKAKIIMDIILLDMAMHSYKGLFSVTSGRCYEEQKKHPLKQDTLEIAQVISGYKNLDEFDYKRISANFHLLKNYDIPEVIKDISRDESNSVIKTSMGLNLKEVSKELGDVMDIEEVGYYFWAMEAFTNHESVRTTMKMFRKFNMIENIFLKDLKVLNNQLLNPMLPIITKILNPATNGVAIQRANTYTYRTKDYMLSTTQNYHPGTFADQQHIWQATLSDKVTVFTTHPASPLFDDNSRNFSPSYWVGSGILPHSVQSRNVNMSIYKVDQRKGYLEGKRLHYTHAYFPKNLMDEVVHDGRYIFGRVNNTFITLIGLNELKFNKDDPSDLLQEGKVTYWICEISNDFSNMDNFIKSIKSKAISFKNLTLTYKTRKLYKLKYKGEFRINNDIMNTNYPRLNSPYSYINRKDSEMHYTYNKKSLYLNFDKGIRKVEDVK